MGRVARHIVLFLASAVAIVAFYVALDTPYTLFGFSLASSYASLGLLAWALMIGPWNRLRGRPNPVSGYLRRDVGIWAGILALVHTVIALQVHFASWLHYFLRPPEATYRFPLRLDLAGFTNWAGLFAMLILAMLLGLSNDASIRKLGGPRWKGLQRWNYAAAALVVVHGIAYMFLEKRSVGLIALYTVIVVAAAGLQYLGFRKVRSAGR